MEIIYIITTVAIGATFLLSYRKGLRDGLALRRDDSLQPLLKPPRKKETKEQLRAKLIAQNIANYKGDDEGQVKVNGR